MSLTPFVSLLRRPHPRLTLQQSEEESEQCPAEVPRAQSAPFQQSSLPLPAEAGDTEQAVPERVLKEMPPPQVLQSTEKAAAWSSWESLSRCASVTGQSPAKAGSTKKGGYPGQDQPKRSTSSHLRECPKLRLDSEAPPQGHKSGAAGNHAHVSLKSLHASLLPPSAASKVARKVTLLTKVASLGALASLALVLCLSLLWRHTSGWHRHRHGPAAGGTQARDWDSPLTSATAFPPASMEDLADALGPQRTLRKPVDGDRKLPVVGLAEIQGPVPPGPSKPDPTRGTQLRSRGKEPSRADATPGSAQQGSAPKGEEGRQEAKPAQHIIRAGGNPWSSSREGNGGGDPAPAEPRGALLMSWLEQVRRKRKTERYLTKLPGCPRLPNPDTEDVVPRHYPNPATFERAECRCSPVHNFVVLSMQRSGSGWFETFLNSHTNISSFGEILGNSKGRNANLSEVLTTLDKVYNLDWRNSAAKNECSAAVGFKWMLNQGVMAHREAVTNYLLRYHVSVILLVRRNVLRRLISILANAYDRRMRLLNGQHKSHVHSKEEAKLLAAYKPRLGVRHLIGNLQRVQQIVDDAVRAFNTTRLKVISYEEVVRNPKVLEDVQQFLGVPVEQLHSRQVKIHTKPLNESIENYRDVARQLRGTALEFVLNDEYS